MPDSTAATKTKEIPAALDLLQKRLAEQQELLAALRTSLTPVFKADPDAVAKGTNKCGYPGIYGVIVDSANCLNSSNENIRQILECLAL
jgi:hypothetical protein